MLSILHKPAVISPSWPAVFKPEDSVASFSALSLSLSFIDFKLPPVCWPPVWGLVAYDEPNQSKRRKNWHVIHITSTVFFTHYRNIYAQSKSKDKDNLPYLVMPVLLLVLSLSTDFWAPPPDAVSPFWINIESNRLQMSIGSKIELWITRGKFSLTSFSSFSLNTHTHTHIYICIYLTQQDHYRKKNASFISPPRLLNWTFHATNRWSSLNQYCRNSRYVISLIMSFSMPTYLLCTKRMKCWGGTKARSISTSATTIFFASPLNPSKAADAMVTTWYYI